jgi:hypothetical protein
MTYKICQVIFSTNRLEYLIPTLRAQKNLNFYGCEVHKIFIDDYPKTRNNAMITELVKLYGYNEVILHEENKGLSVTWSEFWDLVKERDYDFIWHQEDDVEILEPILITDLIDLLKTDPLISQIQLARQAWYFTESDPAATDDDKIFKNFRYDKNRLIFSPMASLYPADRAKVDYRQFYNYNMNEGLVGKVLYDHYGMTSCNVRNFHGKQLINHIGDWFVGKRVLPGEPNYSEFAKYDPDKKYNSKDGAEYK